MEPETVALTTLKNDYFTFIGSLNNSLRKWFFREPWVERFFEEP